MSVVFFVRYFLLRFNSLKHRAEQRCVIGNLPLKLCQINNCIISVNIIKRASCTLFVLFAQKMNTKIVYRIEKSCYNKHTLTGKAFNYWVGNCCLEKENDYGFENSSGTHYSEQNQKRV